jgi:HK97 gp10 family phage protein
MEFIPDPPGLAQLLEGSDGPLARWLLETAITGETNAKKLCPVDTGRLRASITHEVGKDGKGLYGKVGTNVDYAPYVELGTSSHAPQPFLRPGVTEAVQERTR